MLDSIAGLTLERLLLGWHNAHVGFAPCQEVVILRIGRYLVDSGPECRLHHAPLFVGPMVWMPVCLSKDPVHFVWQLYRVGVLVSHHGFDVNSVHFTCQLIDENTCWC